MTLLKKKKVLMLSQGPISTSNVLIVFGLCEWGVNLEGRRSCGHVTSPTGTLVAIATTSCSKVAVHYFGTLVAMAAAAQMLMEFGVWQIQSFMKMSGGEPNPINSSCSFFIDLFFMPRKVAE